MSYLTVMQAVAANAGIRIPATAVLDEPDQIKLGQFINEAGQEIIRRVDWSVLRTITSLASTGTDDEYAIADDFARLAIGPSVLVDGTPMRGSLTPDEWFSLEAAAATSSSPARYYYLRANNLSFYPYPASGSTIRVQYQSLNWVNDGDAAVLELDADEPMISESLLTLGGIWRWRRHVGKDYADHMAEFESVLIDEARFDSGIRSP
jgi:hypothetical protein